MEHYDTVGQELVKCVLVGDTATGKTRLVCARALNARVSLRQLLRQHHVPTVFAIDQYRIYKEVAERSVQMVDGVQVSLRLWDTFGDHEKDRRFAYGRSDVILLCFSIGNKNSLHHCKTTWYPEIKRFCPDTPIVLVGCKNDLRFLVKDPTYLSYCRERIPFMRPIREADLVMPEQARAVAKEFGVPYYETSVFTFYGMEVFENAIRCALIARRNQRFWMNNMVKHVQQPLLQAPYCPPKKEFQQVDVYPSTFSSDMKDMLLTRYYPDLVFVSKNSELLAHRFVIAAAIPSLSGLLRYNSQTSVSSRRFSDASTVSDSTVGDTECLLKPDSSPEEGHFNSVFSDSEFDLPVSPEPEEAIRSPLIIDVRQRTIYEDVQIFQVVLTLDEEVSLEAVRALVHLIYTGELFPFGCNAEDLKTAAELLNHSTFSKFVEAWTQRDAKLMSELRKIYKYNLKSDLWAQCLSGYCCDIQFELEDGEICAHKALLMSRSEVMRAMFSRDFREKWSERVSIPDVRREVFIYLLEYLYTDAVSTPVSADVGMQVLQLANRLCLTRLVNFMESAMITDFTEKMDQGVDVMECCIRLLEPSQLHNIDQLAEWCLIQLATNYDLVCRKHGKLFKELSTENRQWISQYRWPPIWYVKDFDYYQKALYERYRLENPEKKGRKRNNSGCLCFPGKSSRKSVSYDPTSQLCKAAAAFTPNPCF